MKEYLLGIDIGTSACKIAIFDRNGNVQAGSSESYPVYYPKPGYAQQDPRQWWSAACKAIRESMEHSGISGSEIAGIGVDGQSWSAIALDKQGEVLTDTPIWMDVRSTAICEEMNTKIGSRKIFESSGNSLQPSYTTGKILWYKKEMPQIYEKTDKILQSNSYIVYRLTGRLTQDKSQGYGLHCFHMKKGIWDRQMCLVLGIQPDMLPDLFPCHEVVGTVSSKAAGETGLCAGIPVVAGGLDAACGALGAGVIRPGETQEQGGQAGGMSICMDRYQADERLILSYHVVPDVWLLQGGTTGGGGVMRWLEQELGAFERELGLKQGRSSLDLMNEIAEKVNPGSDGLIFLPYMAGERSPIWNPDAKGVYYGLDFQKTKGHLIRAAMEGVALSLKHNLEIAEEAGANVKVMLSMGGAANSLLWTQIKSDVTGKPVIVPASDTATTLGAAVLAGVGIGMYRDFEEAVSLTVEEKRRHQPNQKNASVYQENYETYLALYQNLKGMMRQTGGK